MVKWVFSILQNTWKYSVYADNRKLDIKFIVNKTKDDEGHTATGKVDIGNNTDSNGFNFTNTYVQEADTGAPDPTRPDPVNPGTGPDDDYTKYGSLK